MIHSTKYTASLDLIQEAIAQLPDFVERVDLNCPTGNFFYDAWEPLKEIQNTVWGEILETLPIAVGQARLMKLQPGQCYRSHADLDNRYHLSLVESRSYLVDLDNTVLHPINKDGIWYEMDAGLRHSAVNFGDIPRIQLVIRKLLVRGDIAQPVNVEILNNSSAPNFRFVFDDIVSPFLSRVNKSRNLDNFKIVSEDHVSFTIEQKLLDELTQIVPTGFLIKCQ